MILGTSIFLSKSGPADLLTITKMLQTIQEKYGNILEKYYLCKYETQQILKCSNICPGYNAFFLCEILNLSFYIIFYEDEDRKNIKIGLIKSREAWM